MSVPPTLCVRLDGPLAAYGGPSKYRQRYTEPDPTLSAIQGMLAAAAGIPAHSPLPDHLVNLQPVLRQERAGTPLIDYHTINQADPAHYPFLSDEDQKRNLVLANEDGYRATFDTVETQRHYLADSSYLLLLNDPDQTIQHTLTHPTYSPYLGRLTCAPTEPFLLGRTDHSPWDAATTIPTVTYHCDPTGQTVLPRTIITFDHPHNGAYRTTSRNDRTTTARTHQPQRRHYHQQPIPVTPLTYKQPAWEPIAAALTPLEAT